MKNTIHIIKNGNRSSKLSIYVEDNLLKIKINNSNPLLYSYDELIDCSKRFKAFYSIEEIYSLIIFLIEKEEIEIISNKLFILKGWKKDIVIPLKTKPTFSLINRLNLLFQQFNSQINRRPFKLKVIKEIKDNVNWMYSMCILRDGRIVSGSKYRIVIYDRDTYQSNIIIGESHAVSSVCGLRNGNLASSCGCAIIIYEIIENDYKIIHTLAKHTKDVTKVIEMEDGRLCSCSSDNRVIIWDKNYQSTQILEGHSHRIQSVIEMNEYIISVSHWNDSTVRIWNKYTYQCVKVFEDMYCWNNNSAAKLNANTIILGSGNGLYLIDTSALQFKSVQNQKLGEIASICVLREDCILLGSGKGEIICYDSLSDQIIFSQKMHDTEVYCIIKNEDNEIFSSSYQVINVYR